MTTLPAEVETAVSAYLRAADRLLPGAVVACAVAGSVALGAYREGRSDIDLLVVLDDEACSDRTHDRSRGRTHDLNHGQEPLPRPAPPPHLPGPLPRLPVLPRLRALHLSQVPRIAARLAAGKGLSATCNASFVYASQLQRPVRDIVPVASHTGELFAAGAAFDVNPVVWRELLSGGVPVRGAHPAGWGLDPQTEADLRGWNRDNLRIYWSAQLARLERRPGRIPLWTVEWCVLGPARLHATIRTGEVLSKEAAGERLLLRFPVHRQIIGLALAHLRGDEPPLLPRRGRWRGATADLMREVIADALRTGEQC